MDWIFHTSGVHYYFTYSPPSENNINKYSKRIRYVLIGPTNQKANTINDKRSGEHNRRDPDATAIEQTALVLMQHATQLIDIKPNGMLGTIS